MYIYIYTYYIYAIDIIYTGCYPDISTKWCFQKLIV